MEYKLQVSYEFNNSNSKSDMSLTIVIDSEKSNYMKKKVVNHVK